MAGTKNHPFHIVDPSPWPFSASVSALLLTMGFVIYKHDYHPWGELILGGGALWLLFTLWQWWKDVIQESKEPGNHTLEVKKGFKYGMALFILTEVMFFAAFFWAYFHAALIPTQASGMVWPPKGIQVLDPLGLPYLNTLILLLSGSTITWAHYDLLAGHIKGMMQKTGYTILLGSVFLAIQLLEYGHTAFSFKDGIYPSTFFLATGFHGFHVFVGTIFLIVGWWRARQGHFTKDDHFGFEAAAWYWHFVDVVWLFLFVSIYWWGSA